MIHDEWIWWKHGVIYQIYPRSFYDSNEDGIGDIRGIIAKLDYLQELGVDAIWLSPINTSPMYDFGYDISNYREIDTLFGTKNDFRDLLKEAHGRGIRVIMDLVLNHTSHLHPWFQASRISRRNRKRDWYIWHDSSNRKPPNNWISAFGGPAWAWDGVTCQYYLHSFLEEQPDLNWRNSDLKNAVFDDIKYWLDEGVDGFRLDVVNWLIKDRFFRNNPLRFGSTYLQKHKYDRNRPETHGLIREFRSLLDRYESKMAVGEVFTLPPGDPGLSASYMGSGDDELHLTFDFSIMYRLWGARNYYKCIKKWYERIPEKGWPCNVLSNHDQPRGITRYGGDEDAEKRARVAATLHLTLKGTPFIYYGEEIGMKNNKIKKCDLRDPLGKKYWPVYAGRDPARTPMQWSPGVNAGFSRCKSWLPVCADYQTVNVEFQRKDRYSLLNYYKSLTALRRAHKSLQMGSWIPADKGLNGILSYFREFRNEKIFVALNFTDREKHLNHRERAQWKVVLSTHNSKNKYFTDLDFKLSPYEATIVLRAGDL
jgi:alpha-glucosidase